jgi:hypothetical protein
VEPLNAVASLIGKKVVVDEEYGAVEVTHAVETCVVGTYAVEAYGGDVWVGGAFAAFVGLVKA